MSDKVLPIHILAGTIGLLSGFFALYSGKGTRLHRQSGLVFVVAMLGTAAAGLTIAIRGNVAPSINVPAALLTAYLVVTSLTTVRPARAGSQWIQLSGLLVALGVSLVSLNFGRLAAIGQAPDGMPAFPFFMFGTVGLLGAGGDVRLMLTGPARGVRRVARHLWRMCFALFIAALSFFIGQADVFPEPIRIRPLLALPVLAVIATMFYWLWRVRVRQSLRGILATRDTASAHG